MKGLIQRVTSAQVQVDGAVVGEISQGLLLFLGVEKSDDEVVVQKLLNKVLNYRVFEDDSGKMNLSLQDIEGELLVVSQFTLVADTRKGARPSFSSAAPPQHGRALYDAFVAFADQALGGVQTGQFGADMQVSLTNAGPVTFLLEV